MNVGMIVLAVLLPPVAMALRRDSRWWEVLLAFALWVFGWFPGVIYTLWHVLGDGRTDPVAANYYRSTTPSARSARPAAPGETPSAEVGAAPSTPHRSAA